MFLANLFIKKTIYLHVLATILVTFSYWQIREVGVSRRSQNCDGKMGGGGGSRLGVLLNCFV